MNTRATSPHATDGIGAVRLTVVSAVAGLTFAAGIASAADIVAKPTVGTAPGVAPRTIPPGGAAAPLEIATGHILLELDAGVSEARLLDSARALGLTRRGRVYGSQWVTVGLPANADPRAMAKLAADLPGVLRATVDPLIRVADHFVPRDPLYTPAGPYCDPLLEICTDQWGLFQVGAEGAWHETTGSPDVVIAVLDSGVDLDHDDLYGNIWTNPGETPANGADDDGNGIVDDVNGADFVGDNEGGLFDNAASFDGNPDVPEGGEWIVDPGNYLLGISFVGDPAVGDGDDNNFDGYPDIGVFHGTAVAGIAAAMTDNSVPGSTTAFEGMAGACGSCSIMPVRMINAEGSAFGSDAASAIRYAADMGANIINASWGLDINGLASDNPEIAVLADAIDHAVGLGVIIVAAAGNSGTPGVHYPATDRRVIAVGSSGPTDDVSWFSSGGYLNEIPDNGLDDDGNGWVDDVVDVVAPGEGIWSTWVLAAYDSFVYEVLFGLPDWPPGADTYSAADGTSFATPLVAGYLGLLMSRHPGSSLAQLREVLRSNAWSDIGGPGYDAASGFGRLQMVVPVELPVISNQAPVADILGDQSGSLSFADTGKSGAEKVTLDGSGSYDPDGYVVSYQWSWDDGGVNRTASGAQLTVELATGPTYEFSLAVQDEDGAVSDTDVVTVTITAKSGGSGGPGKGGGGGGGGGRKSPK